MGCGASNRATNPAATAPGEPKLSVVVPFDDGNSQTTPCHAGEEKEPRSSQPSPPASVPPRHGAVKPPELIEQVRRALAPGSEGTAYVTGELLRHGQTMDEWTAALSPLVRWVVDAAAASPYNKETREKLRALLANKMFTTNLTNANFEELRAMLKGRMLELGASMAELPADASGVDLNFSLNQLAAPNCPDRAAQSDPGVLPTPRGVDWGDPVMMYEGAYIHMLRIVGIAVDAGFQARVGATMRRAFGESYGGHASAGCKSYARMLGKLVSREDHRYEERRPRPTFNLDVVRAAVTVPATGDIPAALRALSREFGGFVKQKNKYLLSPERLKQEFYLRLILVSMVHQDAQTFGELVRDAHGRLAAYAAPGQAHLEGQPESRRRAQVETALSWLRAPELAGRRVCMTCEVQVMTEETTSVRHGMHELFKLYRAPDKMALFKDLDKSKKPAPESIWFAARDGETACLERFLGEAGADVDKYSKNGVTALYCAAEAGHPDAVALLLRSRADPSRAVKLAQDRTTPLHIAAQYGHREVVEVLLGARADAEKEDIDGAAVLYFAAANGYRDIVELLLGAGAACDRPRAATGSTPLLMAAQNGYDDVVRTLLKAGADKDRANNDSDFPLFVASVEGHVAVVRELISFGAIINNHAGEYGTPLEAALESGWDEVATMLRNNGADESAG